MSETNEKVVLPDVSTVFGNTISGIVSTIPGMKDTVDYEQGKAKAPELYTAGAVTTVETDSKTVLEEYEQIHDGGKNVQRDSDGNVVTMTPTTAKALSDAIDEEQWKTDVSNDSPDLTEGVKNLLFGADAYDVNLQALADARKVYDSSESDYTPRTNAESFAKALMDYQKAELEYDANIAEAKEKSLTDKTGNRRTWQSIAESREEEKLDYERTAMAELQDRKNRLETEGAYGTSIEVENDENLKSSTDYELDELADLKESRREARKSTNKAVSDVGTTHTADYQLDL